MRRAVSSMLRPRGLQRAPTTLRPLVTYTWQPPVPDSVREGYLDLEGHDRHPRPCHGSVDYAVERICTNVVRAATPVWQVFVRDLKRHPNDAAGRRYAPSHRHEFPRRLRLPGWHGGHAGPDVDLRNHSAHTGLDPGRADAAERHLDHHRDVVVAPRPDCWFCDGLDQSGASLQRTLHCHAEVRCWHADSARKVRRPSDDGDHAIRVVWCAQRSGQLATCQDRACEPWPSQRLPP
jgi:hypothetical protein